MSSITDTFFLDRNRVKKLEERVIELEEQMEWLMVRHHEAKGRCMPVPYEEDK